MMTFQFSKRNSLISKFVIIMTFHIKTVKLLLTLKAL